MRHPISVLAAASFLVPAVFAAEDPLDQIIVTGSRSPVSVADVGNAVTVITREDIEGRQARYVSDLLRAVPGFAVSHSGVVGSQTQVRVRGSEANHVLVLIDGVRANDPATGDEFRWEYLSTANVERVEIVRGRKAPCGAPMRSVVSFTSSPAREARPPVSMATSKAARRRRVTAP